MGLGVTQMVLSKYNRFFKVCRTMMQVAAVFALFAVFSAHSQVAAGDSLIGKKIHVFIQDDDFTRIYFDNIDKTRGIFIKEAPYTWTLELTAAIVSNPGQRDFMIRTDGSFTNEDYKYKLTPSGLSTAPRIDKFQTTVFDGHPEIWIIVDPTKPLFDSPPVILFEAPKRIHMLNPWPTTGPKIVSAAGNRSMSTASGNVECGWFWTLLLDPAMYKLHFAEINNAAGETYGLGGLGTATNYDLAAEFAKNGNDIWLNTQTNTWSKTKPNVDGECQYQMAATVRDFSAAHPDFDIKVDALVKGMVQANLGPDRKPISTNKTLPTPMTYGEFNNWWKTDSTNSNAALRSYESCVDIPMSKSSDGSWEYDSYRDGAARSFFPIPISKDKNPTEQFLACYNTPGTTNWTNTTAKVNGNFCVESHASFIYQKGQKFAFRGDDDVWVFINDKLVVDLGGIHVPKSDSVNLDTLELTAGSEYKWDLFYCDREDCGSSLRIKTSIYFKQKRALDTTKTVSGNTTTIKIYKRVGGTGSCASVGTTEQIVDPTNLIYELRNGAGLVLDSLKDGITHGGINIATPSVTVNVESITDLAPGKYTIVAFEAANSGTTVTFPFTVPSRNFVEFEPPYAVDTLVTAMIPLIIANREATVLVPAAFPYTVTYTGTAKVFADAAGTTPIASGTARSTKATGLDTVWVTGNPAVTTDQTLEINTVGSSKVVRVTLRQPPPIYVELQAPYVVNVPVTTKVQVTLATLQKGLPLAAATPYVLGMSAGAKVFSDAALTVPVPATGLTTSADGLDTVWVVGDPAAFTDQVVTLTTVGSTKQVKITFQLPPIVLPAILSAGVFDDDGNGIGDRITVVYDSNMTNHVPKQVSYQWPGTAAAVPIAAAGFAPLLDPTGKVVTISSLALSTTVLTQGDGTWQTTFTVRGKDTTMTVPLKDRMAPILLKAEAKQGISGDTLFLTFSEPISVAGITVPPGELFQYKTGPDGTPVSLPPTSWSVTAGNTVANLIYAPGTTSPQPGQLVRVAEGPGHIADAVGNGAGTESRYRLIQGVKKTGVTSVTLMEGDLSPMLATQPAVTIQWVKPGDSAKAVSQATGRLGHLLKIDLGDYAVKDDFSAVEPKDVHLKWDVIYYDNLGQFVNRASGDLYCTDPIFKGDCTQSGNRGNLFIGWSLYHKNGGQVGTGAYISRLKIQAWAGTTLVAENTIDEKWGYIRKH
jgi:fibro-slime domain-containing protein